MSQLGDTFLNFIEEILMLRPLATGSWCKILSVAVAGLLLNTAVPARAGMVISVQSVSASAGSSGDTLEVDLQNTGASAVSVAAFSFELTVPGGSGISFDGADYNTSQPYIFAGTSFLGPTISISTGTTLDAGDLSTSSASVGPGSIVGLGRVFFDVAGSAPSGPVIVTLTTSVAGTSLTAPDGSNIPISTFNNGTITILAPTVPEPSALVSGSLGLLGAAWMIRTLRASRR
jgi:hypothetical protein